MSMTEPPVPHEPPVLNRQPHIRVAKSSYGGGLLRKLNASIRSNWYQSTFCRTINDGLHQKRLCLTPELSGWIHATSRMRAQSFIGRQNAEGVTKFWIASLMTEDYIHLPRPVERPTISARCLMERMYLRSWTMITASQAHTRPEYSPTARTTTSMNASRGLKP